MDTKACSRLSSAAAEIAGEAICAAPRAGAHLEALRGAAARAYNASLGPFGEGTNQNAARWRPAAAVRSMSTRCLPAAAGRREFGTGARPGTVGRERATRQEQTFRSHGVRLRCSSNEHSSMAHRRHFS